MRQLAGMRRLVGQIKAIKKDELLIETAEMGGAIYILTYLGEVY